MAAKQQRKKGGGGGGGGGCPFASAEGYATEQGRQDWLAAHGVKDGFGLIQSLDADPDPTQPLYYWQLHSLLGPRKIEEIIRRFYTRVYADEEDPAFRRAFTQISGIEHHIETQTAFWLDNFGGGRKYHGSDFRLNFHHTNNAKSVMNAGGAKRWMHHMGLTMCEMDFSSIDVRIKPCLVEFLRTKIKKYAKSHGWKFDQRDFDWVERDPEMVALYERETCEGLTAFRLEAFNARELRRYLTHRGVDMSGCVEKADLLALAMQTLDTPAAEGAGAGAGAGAAGAAGGEVGGAAAAVEAMQEPEPEPA
jgi:truncated hemoglobin YjbI